MKKLFMILMMAFTMMTTVFAEVKLLPKDILESYTITCGDEPVQLQIGYVVNSWEEVYKKTGKGKYAWIEKHSDYCDVVNQCFVIIKFSISDKYLCWACYEYPGDGSETFYVTVIGE